MIGEGLYILQVINLKQWFIERLPELGKFTVSYTQLQRGCDSLSEPWQSLVKEAHGTWLKEHNYELSYRQMCSAFFEAAKTCGVMVQAK